MANISYRLGEQVAFDRKDKTPGANSEVAQTFDNLRANLAAVGVDLSQTKYQLGRTLDFDPKGEQFAGDRAGEANAFLTRNYRAPYVVPETV
jgi:hypothetical protein